MSETSSAGSQPQPTEIVLAGWGDRFLAWLIDFIIVNTVRWAITSLVFFAYWIYFETTTGQSLGKMALRIKTTDLAGNKVDVRSAAIQSFGKAFLLPIDVVLSWIFTNDKRQRIFSRAGNTIVVKMKSGGQSQDIRYTKG